MTNLNLQKRAVKNVIVNLIIITISTLFILLPISIVAFCKGVEKIQNVASGFRETRLALLPITIIILIIEITLLGIWVFRYLSFKKITFPTEEIKTGYCKKVSLIKIFSTVGLKIKLGSAIFIYISCNHNEDLDVYKKELSNKTISLKCYKGTNIIKQIDKNSIKL